jgi:GNAT superfamily N-acetyltransferase
MAGDHGEPASMVGSIGLEMVLSGVSIPMLAIGSVATLSEYRGRGLASRLLKAVMEAERERYPAMLVSGDRGLYLRHGCVPFGDLRRAIWRRDLGQQVTSTVRLVTRDEIERYTDAMYRLYAEEPYRFRRTPSEMYRLLMAVMEPRYRNRPAECQVGIAQQEGAVVAYAVFLPTYDGKEVELLEWAGQRAAVLDLTERFLTHSSYETVALDLMPTDREFLTMLAQRGAAVHHALNHGTMAVLHATHLMHDLTPLIREKLGGDFVFSEEGTRLVVHGTQSGLARPILEVNSPAEFAAWLFSASGLAIPTVSTQGLNYV